MNSAKSVLVNNNARVMKTILDFQAANGSVDTDKKDRIQKASLRILLEQELDLVVGRSIN